MRSLKLFALLYCAALCLAVTPIIAATQGETASSPETITTANGYQMLSEIAITHLAQNYSVPITVEDTLYVHDSEIDKSDPKMPRYQREPVSITYTMTPPLPGADLAARKAALAPVLRDVVQKYNAARGAEMYQVVESDIGFHIVPKLYRDTSGNMQEFHSILETPITIGPGEKTIEDVFDEITKQLNATVAPMGGFSMSFRPLGGQPRFLFVKTNLTATNEPARSVFDRAFADIRSSFYAYPNSPVCCIWQINTIPGQQQNPAGGLMFINLAAEPRVK